jgi:isopropylmalate/homocitrate/citramalate synthase
MSEPWNNDMWFTSPWNFEDEVKKDITFDSSPKIHDVTLRDGEQQAGVMFNKDEKIRIAESLAEVGVHRIEAGMPVVSKSDEQAIIEIVKRLEGSNTEVFSFARCMADDVKRSADTGVKGIIMEVPSSTHMIERAYRWELDKAIETSVQATQVAKECGLYTVFFPIDFSRAPIDWVLGLLKKVALEGHMDALAIVDTLGVLNPHTVPYVIKKMREVFPNEPFEPHFHDDFGMGVANTLMAMAEGCQMAHTSVSGLGERAGNCAYEELALAMKTMYDVDMGLKTERFTEVSRLVQELAQISLAPNRCVVGENLYDIESGIIVSWLRNCGKEFPTELVPFRAELVGQSEPKPVIGKGSGIDSINWFLDQLGITASEEEKMALLNDVKDKSLDLHRLLSLDEFKELAGEN